MVSVIGLIALPLVSVANPSPSTPWHSIHDDAPWAKSIVVVVAPYCTVQAKIHRASMLAANLQAPVYDILPGGRVPECKAQ